MTDFQYIVVLTGAGLSAESGLSTFRDKDGIWAKYDYREVATPQGFARNPELVHDFYNQRRRTHGAHTVELNLEPSDGASLFTEANHGPATQIVPAYVEKLLGG